MSSDCLLTSEGDLLQAGRLPSKVRWSGTVRGTLKRCRLGAGAGGAGRGLVAGLGLAAVGWTWRGEGIKGVIGIGVL